MKASKSACKENSKKTEKMKPPELDMSKLIDEEGGEEEE
jgi:hypothetical protein